MYDVREFHLSDMVRLDAALRSRGGQHESMEHAARTIVEHLSDRLIDKQTGDRSCVLARLFVTLPLDRLEPGLQEDARAALDGTAPREPGAGSVRCLTLLASAGVEQTWRSRQESRQHRVLPLPTPAAVERSPMVSELLRQLDVDLADLTAGSAHGLLVRSHGRPFGVFHVEHAEGSPYVPAQPDFVVPYGVRSVLGFGGVLPDGELYSVICFTRTPVPRETADKFEPIASSVGLVLLPHVRGRVFDSDPVGPGLAAEDQDTWRVQALNQLLSVHEASVLEQSLQLENALDSLADRALELERTRTSIARTEALKSAMLASALDAVVSIDEQGRVLEWNPAAERTFGHRRIDMLGRPMVDLLVPERYRDAHRNGLARYLETGTAVILDQRIEIEALRADGSEVPVELTVARAPVPGAPVFTAFLRDISQERQAEGQRLQLLASERRARETAEESARQLRRLYEMGAALSEAVTVRDVATTTLSRLLPQVGASTGAVWSLDEPAAELRLVDAVGTSIGMLGRSPMALTENLPAAVACREVRPLWVTSCAEGTDLFPQWRPEDGEARSFVALPLRAEQTILGTLIVGFVDEREFSGEEQTFLLSVADQCAQTLRGAQLREREEGAARRLAFLAEAGRVLGTSLDHETTLQQVTELSLSVLGEACVIHLVDATTGRLHQVAWSHRDPRRERLLKELVDYQPPPGSPLERALRTPTTVVSPGLTEAELRAATNTAEEFESARALAVGPSLVVPLQPHGEVIGTVTFVAPAGEPAHDQEDVALAEALAERAAAAIDNARAHAARTEVALTLQRSLMPLDLPEPAGLDVGYRYQPGTLDTEVGGDWFDVIPLSVGRTALVIGDVMGRGIHAAAVMGQLRAAVRAYASLDLPPEVLVADLDRLVQGLGDGGLVTCIYGVLDVLSGELAVCNAGHVPPLLVADGRVVPVELPSGAPLGVGGVRFETRSMTLPDGSALVLYTDGLVESRDRDVHAGIGQLAEVLAGAPSDLGGLCERALVAMGGEDGHDDDAAVLAVRRSGAGADVRCRRMVVDGHDDARVVADARAQVHSALHAWGLGSVAEVCVLLTSELVTNAVRHGGADVEVRYGLVGGAVRVEVHDDGAGLPQVRTPATDDEGGRGLLLLENLSERWGVRRSRGGGKSVWFEVAGRLG